MALPILKLCHAPDGAAMADALRATFRTDPSVRVESGGPPPAAGALAVYVFLLTPAALPGHPEYTLRARGIRALRRPLVQPGT